MKRDKKQPATCGRLSPPIVSANTSMSEGAPLDRGFRETRLRCALPRGHGGAAHLTHLADGSDYAFPRQSGEVWE